MGSAAAPAACFAVTAVPRSPRPQMRFRSSAVDVRRLAAKQMRTSQQICTIGDCAYPRGVHSQPSIEGPGPMQCHYDGRDAVMSRTTSSIFFISSVIRASEASQRLIS